MNNQELLAKKEELVREYQIACNAGIHDSYLYNRIMEINNRIMRHNRWACGNEKERIHESESIKTVTW